MVAIYLDGADLETMARLEPQVDGFTTNPLLMKKAGITRYRDFAREVLAITKKPVSFEVLADDVPTMERQAKEIAAWGENVNVKIPIQRTNGEHNYTLISGLTRAGIMVNVTAVFTPRQIAMLDRGMYSPAIVSIFAGRIADTSLNPESLFGVFRMSESRRSKALWASCREVYNIAQADAAGADIITVSPAIFEKYHALNGKDLSEYSRETVQEFFEASKEIEL